jgi:hypothetical protein
MKGPFIAVRPYGRGAVAPYRFHHSPSVISMRKRSHCSFREMEGYYDHLNRQAFEHEGASDHGQVRAHFDWNPMPEEIDVA